MDNYYVDKPVWMVDLGKSSAKVNGIIVHTWQGAGQGMLNRNSRYILILVFEGRALLKNIFYFKISKFK